MFDNLLGGYVLPFPETTNVGIREKTNFDDPCIYITGDYSEKTLIDYLSTLVNNKFLLSKHPYYGIDVAKYQLPNTNTYIELWVALADDLYTYCFEIFAYLRIGTIYPNDSKHIAFGSYPQNLVRDTSLYYDLLDVVGKEPSETNSNGWNAYSDYYIEYQQKEYSFYKDIEYHGEKYRAMYSLLNRPDTCSVPLDDIYINFLPTINGFDEKVVYFFKFEPINWEIADEIDGNKVLIPTSILDATYFSIDNISPTNDLAQAAQNKAPNGQLYYPNNYEYSYMRSWLNNEFYSTAFSLEEKNKVQTTHVDNSLDQFALSNNDYDTIAYLEDGLESEGLKKGYYNDFVCNDTDDRVYLLSRKELITYDLGYGSVGASSQNINRKKAVKCASDYAMARGALTHEDRNTIYRNCSNFYLRSPFVPDQKGVYVGYSDDKTGLEYSFISVCQPQSVFPAIRIK